MTFFKSLRIAMVEYIIRIYQFRTNIFFILIIFKLSLSILVKLVSIKLAVPYKHTSIRHQTKNKNFNKTNNIKEGKEHVIIMITFIRSQ